MSQPSIAPLAATPSKPRSRSRLAFACAALIGALAIPFGVQAAEAPQCELDRQMRFGGMNWESNLVLVEVERFIVKHAYGCDSEVLPTETLPALAALERGDLDINTELWFNSTREPWLKAEATGKVKRIGDLYMGGEAWFIPRYTAERHPELKKASDLPKFWETFKDPEEPGKGRFYGCPAGWACEVVNGNLYKALGLEDTFTLFSPGTGATQKAALMSAYQRKEDVVFYYWFPTALVGSLDLVQLELPPYDEKKQLCLTDVDCADPQPTAVNTQFAQQAPKLVQFLSQVVVPLDVMNETLAYMDDNELDAEPAAQWFLKNKSDVWKQWLSDDAAQRVQAAL